MRTLRLSLVGTVILALLGGLGGVVLAQDESVPSGPTAVLIDIVDMGDLDQTWTATWTLEATDPSLSGSATIRFNFGEDLMAGLEAMALRVDNDAGAWVGTGRGIGREGFADMQAYTLSGEGAYEGLSAFLSVDIANEPGVIKGVIVEGELPSFPELPEPPAE